MSALGSYLVDAGPPAQADMIVVLAGDHSGGRILKAAELVKLGFAPQALVSGPENCCFGVNESELAIAFAVRRGYPDSYFISRPNAALSTREEAGVMIAEVRKRNLHRIDVVTSDFHTHRAERIYRAMAPDLEIHMVAAADRYFSPDRWWKTREGEKTFVQEWAKTVASWFGI
jgi:uncharacterized SAM-binding protein YcdF (DUF218 family)